MSSSRVGYTFTRVELDGSEVTTTLPHTEYTWPELLEEFTQFLRGCGYVVPYGEWAEYDSIAVVETEEDSE